MRAPNKSKKAKQSILPTPTYNQVKGVLREVNPFILSNRIV